MQTLFGRDEELASLLQLLAESRLLSVVGPGGVGKTTLVTAAFADRSPLVAKLAPMSGSDLRDSIAGSLRFASYEELAASLGEGTLLVLDNCEHVLDEAAAIAEELLDGRPGMSVVATSREPLGLPGEQVVELSPLSTEGDPSPATALFLARMQERGVEIPDSRADIDELCRRLDGLPLALELAAARTAGMAPGEMIEHLTDRLDLLARTRSRGPSRHQSLSATVGWSYQLLEDDLKELFLGLSVFEGLFTAQMAAALLGLDLPDVVERLLFLVDRSLVVHEPAGSESWYRMLSTIRAYGREKLIAAGRWDELNQRLVDLSVDAARDLGERAMTQSDPTVGLETGRLFGVFRSSVEWCLAHDSGPERAVHLVAPLWSLEDVGFQGEAADLQGRVVSRWEVHDALTLGRFALTARSAGRLQVAEEAGRACVDAGGRGTVFGYRVLGMNARADGDYGRAAELLETGSAVAREQALPGLAFELDCHRGLALARAGEVEEALQIWDTVAAEAEPYPMVTILALLFSVLILSGEDLDAATARALRALDLARETDYEWAVNQSRQQLAIMRYLRGEVDEGRVGMADTLGVSVVRGSRSEICLGLRYAAAMFAAAGREDLAGAALAEAEATFGYPFVGPSEQAVLGRISSEEVDTVGVDRRSAAELVHELRRLAKTDPPPAENRFIESGEIWDVAFGGQSGLFPAAKGLADLHELLSRPGEQIAALDLMGAVVVSGDAGAVSDQEARRSYEARIRELQQDIEEAETANDPYRAEKAAEELDRLVDHLSAAYGLAGKQRTAADVAEKARTAVTWRIRAAIRKIMEQLPALGDHLDRSVKTGRFCSYDPPVSVDWSL